MTSPLTKPHALLFSFAILASSLASGCLSHAVHVEPITLAPIQMTVDVNVHSDREASAETAGAEAPADAGPVAP